MQWLETGDARSDRAWRTSYCLVLPLGFFALYLTTYYSKLSSGSFFDFPFGSDVPRYLRRYGNDTHPLTQEFLRALRWLCFDQLGLTPRPVIIKLPFVIIGTLNAWVAAAAFALWSEKWRALLFSLAYGCALTVWYFASVPESYGVTSLLYGAYILLFMRRAAEEPSRQTVVYTGSIIALAVMNDASSGLLLIIPLTYYALSWRMSWRIAVSLSVQLALALFVIVPVGMATGALGKLLIMFREYSPIDRVSGSSAYTYGSNLMEPILGVLFHAIGAPATATTYATPMYPLYRGFFEPTPWAYFDHLVPLAFIATYLVLLAHFRPRRSSPLALALGAFVLARLGIVALFNPSEAMLYANLSVLPLMLFMQHYLEAAQHRYKTLIAMGFALSVIAANARYFF